MKIYSCLWLFLILFSCSKQIQESQSPTIVYESENLIIEKISENIYQHISYLQTNDFGKVSCNGMIVVDGSDAAVFDTPSDSISSVELINYLKARNIQIRAVFPTHFHEDCLAGLGVFHREKIPSISNTKTREILLENKVSKNLPVVTFENFFDYKIGNKTVHLKFFGEGHTKDNIVAYYPDEKILFGGCLIKELGAGKGNLEDANEGAWSETVTKLKNKYPDTQTVIPGHGKRGGMELVDYTIALFQSS